LNSFELNKIALALLLTVLVIFGLNDLSKAIFAEKEMTSHAYPIEVADQAAGQAAAVEVASGPTLADLLAVASVERGAKVFKKCKACHTTDNGGKNLVGPNLWNVVGAAKAAHDGYSYSAAMKNASGDWTFEDLDAFLKKPSAFVAKTKMSFSGLKKPADRANVIAFMRALSDAPVDLPVVPIPENVPEEVSDPVVDADIPEEVSQEEVSQEIQQE